MKSIEEPMDSLSLEHNSSSRKISSIIQCGNYKSQMIRTRCSMKASLLIETTMIITKNRKIYSITSMIDSKHI